jgi:hypothetical protein
MTTNTEFENKNEMKYSCAICKKEIEEKVSEFSTTRFNKSLCMTHQKSQGLTKKESRYKEGMIKGRIAETLIEELFLVLGYNVFRYGMENTVPAITKLLHNVKSEVADSIRRMPDFVIQHPTRKDVYFIEVKFRKSGKFDINDKSLLNYPYQNAYFIIVSKKHIKCITYNELKEGKKITLKSMNFLLGNRKEFDLDKDVIRQFCDFAVKFFEKV